MGGRGGGAPGNAGRGESTGVAQNAQPSAERVFRDAYEAAAVRPGDWVRLPALREEMASRGITSRDAQDAVISDMALKRDVRVIPIANLKSLSGADRNAAIRLGGELKHAVLIER